MLASLTTIEVTFGGSRKRQEVTHCVNISIIADNLVENDETFTVTLSTEDPDVVLNPQNATVIIETNECRFPFPSPPYLPLIPSLIQCKKHQSYFNKFLFHLLLSTIQFDGQFVGLNLNTEIYLAWSPVVVSSSIILTLSC